MMCAQLSQFFCFTFYSFLTIISRNAVCSKLLYQLVYVSFCIGYIVLNVFHTGYHHIAFGIAGLVLLLLQIVLNCDNYAFCADIGIGAGNTFSVFYC